MKVTSHMIAAAQQAETDYYHALGFIRFTATPPALVEAMLNAALADADPPGTWDAGVPMRVARLGMSNNGDNKVERFRMNFPQD